VIPAPRKSWGESEPVVAIACEGRVSRNDYDDVLVPAGKIRVFAGNEAEAAHQGIVTSEA
jgi:hypothetical protein